MAGNQFNPYSSAYPTMVSHYDQDPQLAVGAPMHQQQQQQQQQSMVSFSDALRQHFAREEQEGSSMQEMNVDSAKIAAPVRLDGTNSITITRELHWKHSPEELAANPELLTQTFESSADFQEMRAQGVKLVPQSIRVIEKQNGLPYTIGINFNKPNSDRKTLAINANCMTSDAHNNVDVVLREGAHAPMAASQDLFVTNKYDKLDLTPFQGMHQVTKEELRAGVLHEDASPGGRPELAYADIIVGSAVSQIIEKHAAQYQLDGHTIVSRGARSDNQGNAYEVISVPLHAKNAAIKWGEEMIDVLPFQDPEDLVASVCRLDGKPFDELDNEQDKILDALTTKASFGITISEIYAPFYCTEDGSLAVSSNQ